MGITWRTSSYSNANGGECLEVAETPQMVLLRDTKNRELGHLLFLFPEWMAIIQKLKTEII